jgi:tRNA (guanine-N7-)-methyltransferase
MKKRYRQHVNPLKIANLVPRNSTLELPNDAVVDVELGCGDAQFIIDLAQKYPDRIFIGIDIREEFLNKGRKCIDRLGLTNIHLHTSNLIVDSNRLFIPNRVNRFYINFPDPWFKQRQHNRRWLNVESLDHLINCLSLTGQIFFQSDVWSISLEALALFEANRLLTNRCGEWTFLRENPFSVRSTRERLCVEENLPIWRMLFTRV